MQQFANTHSMRNEILSQMAQNGLEDDCYVEMLDYTIDLFESQGLGTEYYGYHNIYHELEVTYVSLLAINQEKIQLTEEDKNILYVAALFHDFDPQKSVDKPHEKRVIKFISMDKKLQELLISAEIDLEIIKVLILRTTYPWSGKIKEVAEEEVKQCFERSEITRRNLELQQHIMEMGEYLSVIDRISGYVGDFTKSMEMAKMNAHALAWRPSLIIRAAVAYFEEILNKETSMSKAILKALPKEMRKNFFDTVLSFMRIRQQEVSIQADYAYENLKLIPTIENKRQHEDQEFVQTLV
jgi:HD domain.